MLIVRALYGLKSSGAVFREFIVDTLDTIGYRPSYADPYVWMRPEIKGDGFQYWEIVLCYVDYILYMIHQRYKTMDVIKRYFKIKYNKVSEPDFYLGAIITRMQKLEGQ